MRKRETYTTKVINEMQNIILKAKMSHSWMIGSWTDWLCSIPIFHILLILPIFTAFWCVCSLHNYHHSRAIFFFLFCRIFELHVTYRKFFFVLSRGFSSIRHFSRILLTYEYLDKFFHTQKISKSLAKAQNFAMMQAFIWIKEYNFTYSKISSNIGFFFNYLQNRDINAISSNIVFFLIWLPPNKHDPRLVMIITKTRL